MANNSVGSHCGCLYFYSKKGLSQPFYLTRGKTTIGSDFQCNIRIKGIKNIFCNLDSNEAGFTVLVNSNEDERVLVNGVYAQKYSVLSHDDHFQVGDKKFKYCKPDINEEDLTFFRKVVATKMLVGNSKGESKRKSTGVYSLKRLQNSSSRRFSTGSRISEIKFMSALPERNLSFVKTSTPHSASKSKMSQKILRPRHSALGVLKENETFEFPINSRKSNSSTKEDDSSKAEFKAPTPKKNMSSTGNLKELDLNLTGSSCSTPLPTRKKMYSGNLSDVSDFTTPENNISAANITPLNVSKKKVNINKSLLSYAESSTPKSAIRRQRSSSMYRPIVEEITPVSPLPRSSLRMSSLKKPSFTQRRSVNFDICSNSDSSLVDSHLVDNVTFKPGSKRKRCLSDISGSPDKKKMAENSKKSVNILAFSDGDSKDEICELKDTEKSNFEGKETTPKKEESSTVSVGYDSDLEDIFVSLTYKDTSGRRYIDNSCLSTPDQSISAGRYTGRRTSVHRHRTSNAYSSRNKVAETSKSSHFNSSKISIDNSFKEKGNKSAYSGDEGASPKSDSDKMNSFISSVDKSSGSRRNNPTLPSSATKTPKKSIGENFAETLSSEIQDSSSEERSGSETSFNSSVDSNKKVGSPNRICDDNDYNTMSDSLNMNLSTRNISTRNDKVYRRSSRFDNKSFLENPTIASEFTGRTSTPVASNRKRTSKSSSGAANDFPCFPRRSNFRSNSLNLRQTRSRSSINKTTDNSLRVRHLKRRFSVDQSLKSPTVHFRNSIVSSPPSETSISTRATIGSRKSSSESLSGNSSSKHTKLSFKTTRRSWSKSTNSSGILEIPSRNSSATIRTTTPKNTSTKSCKETLDKSTKRISDATENSSFIMVESDDSLSGVSLENTNKSFSNTRKSSAVSTPVSALSKTSNSIIYSFVNSSFDGSLQENSPVTTRSSRLTRSCIDESVYEVPNVKRSSQKSNNDKSGTNNRIREWIQSPAVSKSPMEKSDDSILGAFHEKDPTDIKITEAVFSKYLDSSKETPENISVNYGADSDPTDITTLRRLLRTPRKSAASKNNSSKMHSAEKFQISSTQNNQSAIDNNSRTNTSFTGDEIAEEITVQKSSIHSGNETSITKEDMKLQNSPKNFSKISSVKKLKETPKIQNSPKNYSTNIAGIKKMLSTHKKQKSPKNDLTNIAGIKKLFATPKIQNSPKNDLTNISGIKKMLTTPNKQKSPKNDLTNIAGIKKLMTTPKDHKSPKNDLTDVAGIKRMLRTPKVQKSPANDLTRVAGVKKFMSTPKERKSPKNDLTNVAGLKLLFQSPKVQKSPRNELIQVAGVKKLMATPKIQNSPKNDLTQVVGMKKLMATPKVQRSPKNDLTHVSGVKKLMATPAVQNSPVNDLTNVSGITEMFKTPRERRSAKKSNNISGVEKLLKTPSEQSSNNDLTNVICLKTLNSSKPPKSPENGLSDLRGVKQLLRTPKVKSISNDNDDEINDFELSGIDRLFNESNDSAFDKLMDKKPLRTYIKSPKHKNRSNENCTRLDKPAENVLSQNSDSQNLAVNRSTRSRNGQKQLYDSVKESIPSYDINASETLSFARSSSETRTPKQSKNDASDLIRLLESSRSKRGRKNSHVPTVELDKSYETAVKVASTPLSIQYENENNISTQNESNIEKRKASNKRKHVEPDNEKPKKSKVCKSKIASRDTCVEIVESKLTNTPMNKMSTDDVTHIEGVVNNSFKQVTKVAGKSSRSKKILVQNDIENEAKEPQIEGNMHSKSTRKNVHEMLEESNEDLSKNNEISENKRKKENVKKHSEDSKTDVEKSNGAKKDDSIGVSDYSVSNNLRNRTRRGHKEHEKNSISETDSQNASVDSNITNKRRLKKVTEKTQRDTNDIKIEPSITRTLRARKKIENGDLDPETQKVKKNEINAPVKQNSVDEKIKKRTASEKEEIKITDKESNTQKVKKNMKINKVSETGAHDSSLDINSKIRTRSRRLRGILDNEEVTNNLSEHLSTNTQRVKKEKESENKTDETSTSASENSCKTETKIKKGKNNIKDYEETEEVDVSYEVVQSKTRRGKKVTEKSYIDHTKENNDCIEQNSKTRKGKDTIYAKSATSVNDVDADKKIKIKSRGNIRDNKEIQGNDTTQDIYADQNASENSSTYVENEKKEPDARNIKKSSKKDSSKPGKYDIPIITARNTRAKRGQNSKYDEIEWHTPVKSPSKKIRKNVTFDQKVKSNTPIVNENNSPIRMTRSRRAKKV